MSAVLCTGGGNDGHVLDCLDPMGAVVASRRMQHIRAFSWRNTGAAQHRSCTAPTLRNTDAPEELGGRLPGEGDVAEAAAVDGRAVRAARHAHRLAVGRQERIIFHPVTAP